MRMLRCLFNYEYALVLILNYEGYPGSFYVASVPGFSYQINVVAYTGYSGDGYSQCDKSDVSH